MIFKIIFIYNNNTSRFMVKYFSIFCNIAKTVIFVRFCLYKNTYCISCVVINCIHLSNKSFDLIPQTFYLQIIVCLFMGGHEISIKSIFDFGTSLPINEILYIQYINTYIYQIHYLFPWKYHRRQHRILVFVSFVQTIAI